MDIQQVLDELADEVTPLFGRGKVADYIPALASIDPRQFALSVTTLDGTRYSVGAARQKFSIQSVSKVFAYTLALRSLGEALYRRIGVEPSGDPFNSLVQLEYENGIPRNPFINAGALLVVDALRGNCRDDEHTFDSILGFIRKAADEETITSDERVADSEVEHGYRNLALACLMKSFGNLHHDPVAITRIYFRLCAVAMNVEELSRAMLYLANGGVDPISGQAVVTLGQAKRINALMLTCGHYDASGEFAYDVGLPGKSGVGGGIVAVVPGRLGLAVWAPELNERGNSLVGTKALELFTTKTGFSIF